VAWGPRLILPWVPACAYLLVAAYAGDLEGLLARLTRSPVLFLLLAVALAAASVPQYVAMVHPKVWLLVFATDVQCPTVPTVNLGGYYYRCTEHQMWSKPSMLAAAYAPGADPTPLLIGCACAAALIWLLHRMRAAALRTPSLPSPQGGGKRLRRY
jgi:hypothetical protein